ncbi:hypothetical protein CR513_44794, partial [Mucuna pruriens]
MEKHWRSLSLQEGFERKILFHPTYLLKNKIWASHLAFSKGPQLLHLAFVDDCYCLQKEKLNRWSLLELYFGYFAKVLDKRPNNYHLLGESLTKLVLQALATYVMQSTMLPKSICNIIDRKCKNFIWEDTNKLRKIHLAFEALHVHLKVM